MQLTTRGWRLTLLGVVVVMLVALAVSVRAPESSELYSSSKLERASWARRSLVMRAMRRESDAFARDEVMRTKATRSHAGVSSTGDRVPGAWEIVAADSLGATMIPAVRRLVAGEIRALGIEDATSPLRVIVRRPMADEISRLMSRPAAVESYYLLPERPDDACTIVIAVSPPAEGALSETLERAEGILGPCGFQLAVGSPGRAVRAWLDSVDWEPARMAAWRALSADDRREREGSQDLFPSEMRCLSGDDAACNRVFASRVTYWDDDAALPDTSVLGPFAEFGRTAESREVREAVALSDLMREVGRESFGAWWRSEGDERAAFRTSIGMSREEWTRRWMARSYDVPVISPRPLAMEVAWVVAALGVLVTSVLLTARRARG